ncbi:MAG TPA: Rrf2 family transcriptional regulator [Planctomycetes bacterium]|nr:Rrf2 family transcriptional regulator [Planctomycetota bacterium]
MMSGSPRIRLVSPISRSSEYAIRALTHLAHLPPGKFSLAREMAEALSIPAPFLGKCLQPLVARGILSSQRGRNGGFQLRVSPSEITLYQIVDALEHLSRPRQCFLGQAECSDERACPMHSYWKQAAEAFTTQMLSTTLADVVRFCEENPESGYPAPFWKDPD